MVPRAATGPARERSKTRDNDYKEELKNGDAGASSSSGRDTKRKWDRGRNRKVDHNFSKKKSKKIRPSQARAVDDILMHDITALLEAQRLEVNAPDMKADEKSYGAEQAVLAGSNMSMQEKIRLPNPFTEIEVEVREFSSTGDGLAIHSESKRIYVVPFSVPGDVIKAKVIKHHVEQNYSTADFISVVKAGPLRDDSRIKCKYFNQCSGCQFQMLDYKTQLKQKKTVMEKAYKNFSQLPEELVPLTGDTIGSPLQYGYRTKLTPHFNGPPGHLRRNEKMRSARNYFKEVPKIGFNSKGANYTMDIEDCTIGTEAVRMGMKKERLRVASELHKYSKGATILLRESTVRVANDETNLAKILPDTVKTVATDHIEFKSCVTDNNATTTEYVDDFVFTNIANEFFQNNNSILPSFTQYIRDHILPMPSSDANIKHLIDAYSGSGLFTITLSSLFESSLGIDVSVKSINSARENARRNQLDASRAHFIAADATELFKEVAYAPDETVVLIDPPRKGCDGTFLCQLLHFAPRRIVYVSCNVHTQARDVGTLVRGVGGAKYAIESLRGFDFFPQTSHVEGVAVLSRLC